MRAVSAIAWRGSSRVAFAANAGTARVAANPVGPMVSRDEEVCFDARRHGVVLARPLAQAAVLSLLVAIIGWAYTYSQYMEMSKRDAAAWLDAKPIPDVEGH